MAATKERRTKNRRHVQRLAQKLELRIPKEISLAEARSNLGKTTAYYHSIRSKSVTQLQALFLDNSTDLTLDPKVTQAAPARIRHE